MAKKKILGIREVDELIMRLDLEPVLNSRVRQVRWLYNNSNKYTNVYEEKLVRIIVHRLKERINELENIVPQMNVRAGTNTIINNITNV